jgi:hypothetical protein
MELPFLYKILHGSTWQFSLDCKVCVYGYKVLLCASALYLKGPINGEVGNIFIGAFQKYRCVRTGVKYLQMYARMEIFNLIYT